MVGVKVKLTFGSNIDKKIFADTDVVTIDSSKIIVKSYYDGFRISWPEQNFADNLAISYHLQASKGDDPYVIIYRGSATKYTWKLDLERDISYRLVDDSMQ